MDKIKKGLVTFLLFLFPLFFLTTTQEFFVTNKLYLLCFGVLILLSISTIEFLQSKKFVFIKTPFDIPLGLFILASGLSIIVSSPNKIGALFNTNFGFLEIFAVSILYYYASRFWNSQDRPLQILSISSLFLSIITIIFFFQPFKNIALPNYLEFLKNSAFNPIGGQLDLVMFLGFFMIFGAVKIYKQTIADKQNSFTFYLISTFLCFIALSFSLFTLLKPYGQGASQSLQNIQLPPLRLSWFAAAETLKNPVTALFGVGIDNYSSMFTKVKDFIYVQSPLWQINSFSLARSTMLHIFTETGILGFFAFLLILYSHLRQANRESRLLIYLVILTAILFPPSLTLLLLLFMLLAASINVPEKHEYSYQFSSLFPFVITINLFFLALLIGSFYFLGRAYASEYFFKSSLFAYVNNDAKHLYDSQRNAIVLNPYIERFRINFSQTNMTISNNIAAKITNQSINQTEPSEKAPQLTEQERQVITQAIQAAISEAKAAVTLNPQKAQNWENLATIYRNIILVIQGADSWTVSSYQRAIVLDPQNPIYRLNLGGVYYQLGNFDEAVKLFEQSIVLKSDWPNAHYNLAWALYKKNDYQKAATEMQNALSFLDEKTDSTDYQRAKKELEEFKTKLSKP